MRRWTLALGAAGLAACVFTTGAIVSGGAPSRGAAPEAAQPVAWRPGAGPDTTIVRLQQRLRASGGAASTDATVWGELGTAYVEQARVTADPTYYPKAEAALRRSLALRRPASAGTALVGLGALAAARHDFAGARSWARKALAADPYDASAYAVLADALTQLGDYPGATAAVQRALDLRPGVPSFTRASYEEEQHGRVTLARQALERALALATTGADRAFCRYYLGELAAQNGQPAEALRQYRLGLAADPSYQPLLAGRAKAEAALGRTREAVADYRAVIERVPQPQYVYALGELYEALGRPAEAAAQYRLVTGEQRLFAANGVVDDLFAAQFEADHGSPTRALAHARAEWRRRHSVLVADALAWALHVNGQDREALGYARRAGSLGWRNAVFRYHLGMIELGLGRRAEARRDLAAALAIDAAFSPLSAARARRALAGLKATS